MSRLFTPLITVVVVLLVGFAGPPPGQRPFRHGHTIRADANGIFTFGCPLGGWWGFASLSLADYKIPGLGGDEKEVELGAVLWI